MAATTTRHPEVRDPKTGAGYVRTSSGEMYGLVTNSAGVLMHLPITHDMTPWVDQAGDPRLLTEGEIRRWWAPATQTRTETTT